MSARAGNIAVFASALALGIAAAPAYTAHADNKKAESANQSAEQIKRNSEQFSKFLENHIAAKYAPGLNKEAKNKLIQDNYKIVESWQDQRKTEVAAGIEQRESPSDTFLKAGEQSLASLGRSQERDLVHESLMTFILNVDTIDQTKRKEAQEKIDNITSHLIKIDNERVNAEQGMTGLAPYVKYGSVLLETKRDSIQDGLEELADNDLEESLGLIVKERMSRDPLFQANHLKWQSRVFKGSETFNAIASGAAKTLFGAAAGPAGLAAAGISAAGNLALKYDELTKINKWEFDEIRFRRTFAKQSPDSREAATNLERLKELEEKYNDYMADREIGRGLRLLDGNYTPPSAAKFYFDSAETFKAGSSEGSRQLMQQKITDRHQEQENATNYQDDSSSQSPEENLAMQKIIRSWAKGNPAEIKTEIESVKANSSLQRIHEFTTYSDALLTGTTNHDKQIEILQQMQNTTTEWGKAARRRILNPDFNPMLRVEDAQSDYSKDWWSFLLLGSDPKRTLGATGIHTASNFFLGGDPLTTGGVSYGLGLLSRGIMLATGDPVPNNQLITELERAVRRLPSNSKHHKEIHTELGELLEEKNSLGMKFRAVDHFDAAKDSEGVSRIETDLKKRFEQSSDTTTGLRVLFDHYKTARNLEAMKRIEEEFKEKIQNSSTSTEILSFADKIENTQKILGLGPQTFDLDTVKSLRSAVHLLGIPVNKEIYVKKIGEAGREYYLVNSSVPSDAILTKVNWLESDDINKDNDKDKKVVYDEHGQLEKLVVYDNVAIAYVRTGPPRSLTEKLFSIKRDYPIQKIVLPADRDKIEKFMRIAELSLTNSHMTQVLNLNFFVAGDIRPSASATIEGRLGAGLAFGDTDGGVFLTASSKDVGIYLEFTQRDLKSLSSRGFQEYDPHHTRTSFSDSKLNYTDYSQSHTFGTTESFEKYALHTKASIKIKDGEYTFIPRLASTIDLGRFGFTHEVNFREGNLGGKSTLYWLTTDTPQGYSVLRMNEEYRQNIPNNKGSHAYLAIDIDQVYGADTPASGPFGLSSVGLRVYTNPFVSQNNWTYALGNLAFGIGTTETGPYVEVTTPIVPFFRSISDSIPFDIRLRYNWETGGLDWSPIMRGPEYLRRTLGFQPLSE